MIIHVGAAQISCWTGWETFKKNWGPHYDDKTNFGVPDLEEAALRYHSWLQISSFPAFPAVQGGVERVLSMLHGNSQWC